MKTQIVIPITFLALTATAYAGLTGERARAASRRTVDGTVTDLTVAPTVCIRPELESLVASGNPEAFVPPNQGGYDVDLTGDGVRERVVFFGRGLAGSPRDAECTALTAEAWGFRVLDSRSEVATVTFSFEDPGLRTLLPGNGVWDVNGDGVPEIVLFGISEPLAGSRLHLFRYQGGSYQKIGIDASGRFHGYRLVDFDGDGIAEIEVVGLHATLVDLPEVFRWDGAAYRERTELFPEVFDGVIDVYRLSGDPAEQTPWPLMVQRGMLAAYSLMQQHELEPALHQTELVLRRLDEANVAYTPDGQEALRRVHELRAHIRYRQSQYVRALEEYSRCGAPPPAHLYAALLADEGRVADAIQVLEHSRVRDEETYLLLERLYRSIGRTDQALAAILDYLEREQDPIYRCRTLRKIDLSVYREMAGDVLTSIHHQCGSWEANQASR